MKHSKQDFLDYAKVYNKNLRSYILQVYYYMTMALVLTGDVALLTVSSEIIMNLLYIIDNGQVVGLSGMGWFISIAPISIVLGFGLV